MSLFARNRKLASFLLFILGTQAAIAQTPPPAAPASDEPEGDTAPAEPPSGPTQVMQIAKPMEKPQAKPISKPVKQPPTKPAAVSGNSTTPAKPGGLSRSFLEGNDDAKALLRRLGAE